MNAKFTGKTYNKVMEEHLTPEIHKVAHHLHQISSSAIQYLARDYNADLILLPSIDFLFCFVVELSSSQWATTAASL